MLTMLKIVQCRRIDIRLPPQVGAHLLFYLVSFAESEHALTDNTLQLVEICVVANDH